MISTKALITFVLLAFSISLACADEIRHHTFDANQINALDIDTNVGTLIIERSDSDLIEVEVVLKAEDRKWFWFGSDLDLGGIDIDSRQRGNTLSLALDEDDVSADWIIRIPDAEHIAVDLGVGTVEIVDLSSEFDIHVGVGTIDIETALATTGRIETSAGVGDTRVRGASDIDSKRALVSSDTTAHGDGDMELIAEVGVGDVRIALR